MILKISVLASGGVLLDGNEATPEELDAALASLKTGQGTVWYYRDPAAGAQAGAAVIRKVVANQLPVSISSRPDFSDYLDSQGVSRPREAAPALEELFANVRQTAAGEAGPRGLVIVRPDYGLFVLPALEASPALDQQAAGMERLVPSTTRRNIAVIADTAFTSAAAGAALADAGRAIPFFGMLLGLSYIGHPVWVFGADADALSAGCRAADLLIVDSALVAALPRGWEQTAAAAMRNPNILVHDRASFKLRFARRAGEGRGGGLEFPH